MIRLLAISGKECIKALMLNGLYIVKKRPLFRKVFLHSCTHNGIYIHKWFAEKE